MTREATHTVWQGQVRIPVVLQGTGPALVYFHGPWGLTWSPFLDELARDFTVHAPRHPGTSPEAPEDVYHLDGLWDLVLCYDELLTALGLSEVVLVGHSFGGMVACELAAAYPARVRRQALLAPLGFWRDADPVANWMLMDPQALRARMFRDPDGEAARAMFGAPPGESEAGVAPFGQTGETAVAARVAQTWAMGVTGKFIWPLPDKGLRRRVHRVTAPTLLLWGKDDRVAPPVYADEFTRRIPGARLQVVDGAGHAPHLEQPQAVARTVRDFLTARA
jgi:pimeloyl-ACP methyl ester carboxylesterase